jgi:hypothetical protein
MKGMQNKNNAQDIKDVYVRQYRALHHYFIFDCFVGFGQGFVFSIAFRHETNLSCCTVFWTSKEAELRCETRFTMFLIESSDKVVMIAIPKNLIGASSQ